VGSGFDFDCFESVDMTPSRLRSQSQSPTPGSQSQSLTPGLAETAALAGAIERWAGDLALGEEPARFLAALEDGAPAAACSGPGLPSPRV